MSVPLRNLVGKQFGRLLVTAYTIVQGERRGRWHCVCECRKETSVSTGNTYGLTHGRIKSCGCLHIETSRKSCLARSTHGMRNSRLYRTWTNMKVRCSDPKSRGWSDYGGRGIRVCEEWLRFEPFLAWAITHGYTDVLTIERRNPNGNYEPENCCWIPGNEQWKNTRRFTRGKFRVC